jgi:hypothetical protein
MTIPADHIIAQNQLMYRKPATPGTAPIVFSVRCNCGSSPKEQTARFVQANRHLFITPQQFKDNQWI